MDTTTIEVRSDQKDELDSLKVTDSESYKSVLQRLIETHSEGEQGDETPEVAVDWEETIRTIENRLDELPEETARKTAERIQR